MAATAHLMLKIISYKNVIPLTTYVPITLPDCRVIKSMHTCELNLPRLTQKGILSYIVPNLKQQSLLSAWKLCSAVGQVLFTDIKCTVYHNNQMRLEVMNN